MPAFTALSVYKLISMGELILAEALFAKKLVRRKHFIWRLLLVLSLLFLLSLFFPIFYYEAWYVSIMFIALFFATIPAMKFCFEENWWNITFCAFAGYTVKQLAYVLSYTIIDGLSQITALGFSSTLVNPYSSSSTSSLFEGQNILTFVIFFNVYFLVYWLAYFVLVTRMEKGEDMRFGGAIYLFLSAMIVLIDVVFNMVAVYNMTDATAILIERLYNILTCLLALYIQFSLLHDRKSKNKMDILEELLRNNGKQYAMTKSNIDIINMKCHDLKKQITMLGEMKTIDKNAFQEVGNAVSFYESVVKTGNEALDTILTEKSLFCEKNGIKLTCVVDGKRLAFITPCDTYSLLGNAIENAIEAVENLPKNKRIITVIVKGFNGITSVHVENFFSGPLKMENGIPVTTKKDTNYHGFGMLSIKTIAEKYDGNVSIAITGDVFNLNIIFNKAS